MRWEYKRMTVKMTEVAHDDFEASLNALGAEGWELSSALPQQQHGYTQEVHLLFKRSR